MEGGGWYSFAAPLPDAHPRLAGPLLLRPLHYAALCLCLDNISRCWSCRIGSKWVEANSLADGGWGGLAVSRPGTLTAASVKAPGVEPFVVVSMYAMWENPHSSTGSAWIVSDASAHRLVSDLSAFIGTQGGHRILAAGDLNILRRKNVRT